MRMGALAPLTLALSVSLPALAQTPERVDAALVLAVDVSGSVDDDRYVLQMEGIARAFEDRDVQSTILSGPNAAILVTLVNWSQKPQIAIPWRVISSRAAATTFAADVRHAPRRAEDFTCMSAMLQVVEGKVLPLMPLPADRMVVDVSGDGRDNCNAPTSVDSLRDALVADGATVNGLPIRAGREASTIAQWYGQHVIGGAAAFLLPADGYEDFGRAIRQKFIIEISGRSQKATVARQ
jgi:hypothetical protein